MDRVTKSQKKLLISLLKEVKYIEGKKEREHYWEKIQASLNKIGPKKTIIQWKKCWRDMRLSTRKKLAEIKRSQNTSPPPGIEITQEDNDIIDIVGSEYFYDELGEIKTEPSSSFMPQFEYTPENLCDTILSINSSGGGGQQHPHQHKDSVTAHHHPQEDLPHSSENNIFNFASPTSSVSSSSHMLKQRTLGHTPPEPFEDKILKLMQDTASYCSRKRANRQTDVDKLFLLSLSDDLKKIPEEYKLDVKSELIQVLKKWQNKSIQHYHPQQQRSNASGYLPAHVTPPSQQHQHIDKNKKVKHEYTPQQQQQNAIVEKQQTPSTSATSHQHQVNHQPQQQQQQQPQQHKEPTAILPPPHQTLSHSQAISQGILFTTSMPQHPTLLTQVYGSAPSPINRTYENVG